MTALCEMEKEAYERRTEKNGFAYLCPACGQSVIVERSVFQLAASHNHLPCPCGKSAVEVELTGDRAKLEVPCPVLRQKPYRHLLGPGFSAPAGAGLFLCRFRAELLHRGRGAGRFSRGAPPGGDGGQAAGQRSQGGRVPGEVIMQEVLSELKEIAGQGRRFLHLRQQALEDEGGLQLPSALPVPTAAGPSAFRRLRR